MSTGMERTQGTGWPGVQAWTGVPGGPFGLLSVKALAGTGCARTGWARALAIIRAAVATAAMV
jgi:hypothetical protein